MGCPPAAAPAPPTQGAGTDPPCRLGRWFANLSRDTWESSSSSQEEGQAQSEVLTSGLHCRAVVPVLLCDLHPPSLCSQPAQRAGGSRYHLCRGLFFGHLTRCLIRSFLSHSGTAACPACEPQFALIVIEPRSFFSPNQREE